MNQEEALSPEARKGPISWMARNPVTSTLIMGLLLVGGLFMGSRTKQELFPEVELGIVTITVPYPGASPEEVEQGVVLALEESVRGVDNVKEVRSVAREGFATVTVELETDADADKGLNDVKSAVDRITSFPQDSERPVVKLQVNNRSEVISLVLHGDQSEEVLRQAAEQVRDGLLLDEEITQVELGGIRAREISVEIPQDDLRRYGLTLEDVANRIRAASVELPGGAIKTEGGEVLIRTDERRDLGVEFEDIELRSDVSGSVVRLGDVAKIRDGFAESDIEAFYQGQRAVSVKVFRVGDQTPTAIADATKKYAEDHAGDLPAGIEMSVWNDRSELFKDRLDLLFRNALQGLVLVFLILGLLMEFRLAFWVTWGIPTSFLGALFVMPGMDVSINMISMFAFIIVLGMVVDDAIVVGESIYTWRQKGVSLLEAAIMGTKEVMVPVLFAILTTVAAFAPLLFLPGSLGQIFSVIPVIVISVLLISLAEALFILPSHLAHAGGETTGILGFINRQQGKVARGMEWLIEHAYRPAVTAAVRWRYLTLSITLTLFVVVVGVLASGRIEFTFFPKVDGDTVTAQIRMPVGTPMANTREVRQQLEAAMWRVVERNGGRKIVRGQLTQIGSSIGLGPGGGGGGSGGAEVLDVALFMVPTDSRAITSSVFAQQWREEAGDLVGVRSVGFVFNIGPQSGQPIDVQLSHRDTETLSQAADRLTGLLGNYQGVKDIENGFSNGKPQWDFQLTPEGRSLGLTEQGLGRQLRASFFGAEATRQQRGRDEVRTYVRLPQADRATEHTLDQLLIRTPRGAEVPLSVAAHRTSGRAPSEIQHVDGRRVVSVTADVNEQQGNATKIVGQLKEKELKALIEEFPGLSYTLGGQQKAQAESLASLRQGGLFALLAIFMLLAIPLKSYFQPLVIMSMIPMGIVGAIGGHLLTGYGLSIMSIMGIVALIGVVVNDAIVMLDAISTFRAEGQTPFEAVCNAGARRFRPIFLTSSTTFLGLAPMILETSAQARFLIPMAVSLSFGVAFATMVTLFQVPSLYMAGQDLWGLLSKLGAVFTRPEPSAPTVVAATEEASETLS